MNIGGLNTNLSPDGFHTAIDGYVKTAQQRTEVPDYLSSHDPFWFKQVDGLGDSYIWDEWSGVGPFQKTGDQEEIYTFNTYLGNTKTIRSQKWTENVPISDEAVRADQHGLRAQVGEDVADMAKLIQDKEGIQETYADAFAGAVNTCPDGQALASASHVTLRGDTIDNLETAALDADGLWTSVQTLAEQKGQHGEVASFTPGGTLVPFNLYKTAKETYGSSAAPLEPFSGENQLNIFHTVYGNVSIKASVYLSSAQNSATNAATSWHLVSSKHQVAIKQFYGLVTEFVEAKYSSNDTHKLVCKYNEKTFPKSWIGYVGSNGTT